MAKDKVLYNMHLKEITEEMNRYLDGGWELVSGPTQSNRGDYYAVLRRM